MKRTTVRTQRTPFPILNIAAGHGAEENVRAFAQVNTQSERFETKPTWVDIIPGRAAALALTAQRSGVNGVGIEGRGEEMLGAGGYRLVIANVDRASSVRSVIEAAMRTRTPLLAYLLLRLPRPTKELWGIELALPPDDEVTARDALRFFGALAEVSARGGGRSGFLGPTGDVVDREREPLFRAEFADHTRIELLRVSLGLEPNHTSLQLFDGRTAVPLVVQEHEEWPDPVAVARDIQARPPIPLSRGAVVMVAVIKPTDGIRFVRVALRETDGRLVAAGGPVLDAALMDQLAKEERERLEAEARRAAERLSLSRLAAAQTTD